MNSGKVPVNVLKRSVLRQLKNKRSEIANSAGLGADCAIFEPFSEGQLVTCVQEGVVELQCENDLAEAEREDLSVMPMRRIFQKCANNLAAAGAEPVAAELVIFLPESVDTGDWIEIGHIGAYSLSLRTRFNGFYPDTFVEVDEPFEAGPAPEGFGEPERRMGVAPEG